MALNPSNYALKSPSLGALNTSSAATGAASKVGGFLSKAGSIAPLVGVGLQVAGGIYDFAQEAGKPKHLKDLEAQQFDLMRQKMLADIQAQKEKASWRRGFMKALGGR